MQIIFLLLIFSVSTSWGKMSKIDFLINSKKEIVDFISNPFNEFEDPNCLKNNFLQSDKLKAVVAVGGRIESLNISYLFNSTDAKNYMKVAASTTFGNLEHHCTLKD